MLLAATGNLHPAAAAIVLVVAMVIQAVAEMQHAVSHCGLSFGLAPEDRQGQYQGAAATGFGLASTIGPLLMAGVVALGAAGWLLVAAVMAAASAASMPLTRWAIASRPSVSPPMARLDSASG